MSDRIGILVSTADDVSVRIGEALTEIAEWKTVEDGTRYPADGGGTVHRRPDFELRTIEERHLDATGVAGAFDDPRLIAIASRHAGDTGPLLTAHHTGNFGPADHGGSDDELARAAPNAQRQVLHAFAEHAPEGYDVGMECTHHGPSDVGAPSLFVEVGSGPEQWTDAAAHRAAARAILALEGVGPDRPAPGSGHRHLVGFGGGHYAPRFERLAMETDWAIGHVAADWSLEAMGDPDDAGDVVAAAFRESPAERALVVGDHPDLADSIRQQGHRVVSETWVREASGVALPVVAALEDALGAVADGLRLGAPAAEMAADDSEPVVGEIPADLLKAANAVDWGDTLAAVDDAAAGYLTTDNGTRVAGPVAIDREDRIQALLEALAALLRRDYEEVRLAEDAIVARRREFDPQLAREAGVSPGPAFGRLADGETVTVDGREVTPDAVSEQVERRLSTAIL